MNTLAAGGGITADGQYLLKPSAYVVWRRVGLYILLSFSTLAAAGAARVADMPLAAIQVQPNPLQPKPTLAAERSGNATHGVSQVSGELRYCNAAGMSAMQPRGRLQRLGPGCAVAMQAVS
eukprot:scaffold117588_cov58-Phaeocystis_antarctica.AAC.1